MLYKSLLVAANEHYLQLTQNAGKQMMDWLKKYRITKKYVAMFEKLENAYASASDSVNNGDRERDERRRDKWKCIAQMAEIEKNKLAKQRRLRQENTLSD